MFLKETRPLHIIQHLKKGHQLNVVLHIMEDGKYIPH